jgi:electron transfer flavoprotein alpha/beta subunit
MAAKKKPVEVLSLENLGIKIQETFDVLSIQEMPARKPGVILKTVGELVSVLKKTLQEFS